MKLHRLVARDILTTTMYARRDMRPQAYPRVLRKSHFDETVREALDIAKGVKGKPTEELILEVLFHALVNFERRWEARQAKRIRN